MHIKRQDVCVHSERVRLEYLAPYGRARYAHRMFAGSSGQSNQRG